MGLRLGAAGLIALAVLATAVAASGAGGGPRPEGLESVQAQPAYVPGEVVVRFRAGADRADRGAAVRAAGAERKRFMRLPRAEVLTLPAGTSVQAGIRELEADPSVLYAEPNYIYRAAATPNDPRYGELWGLHQASDHDIDAPEAWDVTTGSDTVKVAVVDTGVAYDHPDLAPNIVDGPGIDDFVDDDADARDEEGHGTHVAGTIGARGNNGLGVTGLNWNVSLLPVRVLGPQGGTNQTVTDGFAYAAANGARVVNASLGGGGFSQAMKDAIDTAAGTTLFVVAAGNDGENNELSPHYPCNYTSVNLICVAATDEDDLLAGFSNYGAVSVDLAAPGTDVLSTWPAFSTLLSEGFETDLAGRWTAGGTPNTWARTNLAHAGGSWSATDSPGGAYTDDANNWLATVGPTSFAGRVGCHSAYNLRLATERPVDVLWVESSTNGTTWTMRGGWSGSTGAEFFPLETDLSALNGQAAVYLRFRLETDFSITDDGAYVDDVALRCISTTYSGSEYNKIDGTSMATPHVSGVAALMLAKTPTLTIPQLKAALLSSVTPFPHLTGLVATSGRLNACQALGRPASECDPNGPPQPPQPPIPPQPPLPQPQPQPQPQPPADTTPPVNPTLSSPSHRVGVASRARSVRVIWTGAADNQSGVDGFSYRLDAAPATIPDTVKDAEETIVGVQSQPLANGRWYFHLRTRDNAGNWSGSVHLGPFVVAVPRTVRRPKKVTLCHRGRTIKVAKSKVKGHRKHGDKLGPCKKKRRG